MASAICRSMLRRSVMSSITKTAKGIASAARRFNVKRASRLPKLPSKLSIELTRLVFDKRPKSRSARLVWPSKLAKLVCRVTSNICAAMSLAPCRAPSFSTNTAATGNCTNKLSIAVGCFTGARETTKSPDLPSASVCNQHSQSHGSVRPVDGNSN